MFSILERLDDLECEVNGSRLNTNIIRNQLSRLVVIVKDVATNQSGIIADELASDNVKRKPGEPF